MSEIDTYLKFDDQKIFEGDEIKVYTMDENTYIGTLVMIGNYTNESVELSEPAIAMSIVKTQQTTITQIILLSEIEKIEKE